MPAKTPSSPKKTEPAAPKRKASPKVRERAVAVHERLGKSIPSPHVELVFDDDPWRLLVAVILSAQSTDKMVNKVMPELLRRWPDAKALATANDEEVQEVIKSTGFFRNKSKSIRGASEALVKKHGGKVPRTMEEMLDLPGVARKSANVVLGAAFGLRTGITVDTHAMRVSGRLGLTKETTPEKIEGDLCHLFEQKDWVKIGHRLVLHGRYVCIARAPLCERCSLHEICPSAEETPRGTVEEREERESLEMESRAMGFLRAERPTAA